MNLSEKFWNASVEQLKCGYIEETDQYLCLLCGKRIEKGMIYSEDQVFYEAGRYIRVHIEKSHQSVFDYLIGMDKKYTGLSEHQNQLLRLFYQGKSDREVQQELEIGSTSTIRNHRFAFKEKERQSKLFLTLMELLKDREKNTPSFSSLQKTAKTLEGQNPVPLEEREEILKKYFPKGKEGPLKSFPLKEKHRGIVLQEISCRFAQGKIYTEKEINAILEAIDDDYVTIRRSLVEYNLMDRKPDGSQYWLKDGRKEQEEKILDRKETLKQIAKETKTRAGVYQVRNQINQKILVEATSNLKTINGKQFQLEMGSHPNKMLQWEWNEFGKDAFTFEVLEELEVKEDGFFDMKGELKKLEEKWIHKLQPFDNQGYHKKKLS